MGRLGSGQTEKESEETSGRKFEKKEELASKKKKTVKRKQEGWGIDIQKAITMLPFEFHPPGYDETPS